MDRDLFAFVLTHLRDLRRGGIISPDETARLLRFVAATFALARREAAQNAEEFIYPH
jgi:hypothetical protein